MHSNWAISVYLHLYILSLHYMTKNIIVLLLKCFLQIWIGKEKYIIWGWQMTKVHDFIPNKKITNLFFMKIFFLKN